MSRSGLSESISDCECGIIKGYSIVIVKSGLYESMCGCYEGCVV